MAVGKAVGQTIQRGWSGWTRYWEEQHRTRRALLVLSTTVALGLVVWVNIQGVPLQGQELLIVLVGGGTAGYGVTRYLQSRNTQDQEDI